MNQSLSSKPAKKTSLAPATATANKKKKKKEQSPRNPLRDLNAISISNNSNNGSEASSSISVEAPRGCLRFFLSHASSTNSKTPIVRPKTLPKTPKSATVVKPSRPSKTKYIRSKFTSLETPEKPMSRNLPKFRNNSSCLNQWHSGKKPSFRNVPKLETTCSVVNSDGKFLNKLGNGSEVDEGIVNEHKSGDIDVNFTPLSKIGSGLGLDSTTVEAEDMQDRSNTRTPPIQASVSPEIQCGTSSVVSTNTTLACYAAGHVLSGTIDKRKCRPKGILNVEENDSGFSKGKALCSFEDDDDDDDDHGEGKGLIANLDVPLPTEASMHWLLSPCDEEDENHKEHSENGFLENYVGSINLCSPFSASGSHGFSSDVCETPKMGSSNNCSRRSTSISPSFQELLEPLNDHFPVLSSPHCTPGCEAVSLKDKRSHHYDYDHDNSNDGQNSSFSRASLGSGNVIRTPQSDASIDNHRKDCLDSELSSVAEAIRMASLSPNSHDVLLIEDQMDSSFQFDCLTTTCNSISRFQKVLDDRDSWLSNSTIENMSQSEMRISWREGLMSRMYDMDEYDCCKCLSDEEEDVTGCNNDPLKKVCQNPEINANVGEDENLAYNSRTAEVLGDDIDDEAGDGGEVEEGYPPPSAPPLSSTCVSVESIITDGDGSGLLASGDSDWNLCYKNELFHV